MILSKRCARLALLGLALVALACAAAAAQDAESQQQQEEAAAAREYAQSVQRANFQLPKMFDFERYKSAFRKSYKSALEELVRLKIFMARSWRVFCSAVGFKHRKSGYYLGLNERSDWTREERERAENKFLGASDEELEAAARGDASRESPEAESDSEPERLEFVEPQELEAQLAEIEKRSSEPGYAELAEELRKARAQQQAAAQQQHQRRRRSTTSSGVGERDFSMEQAFNRSPQAGAARRPERVASNNPEYQAPELMSQGAYEDLADRPDFQKPLYRAVYSGKRREYGHLPVKSQYKKVEFMDSFWGFFGFGGGDNSLNVAPTGKRTSSESTGEFQEHDGENEAETKTQAQQQPAPAEDDLVWVDHRKSGCLNEVQSQGQCGSCYLFAVTAFFEHAYCKETGKLAKFAEQYPLDCNERLGAAGCRGGRIDRAAEFYANFGAELASSYPYAGRQEMCPYAPETDMTHMGYLRLDVSYLSVVPHELIEEYLENTPMVINIDTAGDFQEYGGGVWDGRECEERQKHSMLLIGHGREDGEEYWLIRNSYGPDWGEAGHMKLNKNSQCIQPRVGWVWGARNGADVRLWPERNKHVQQPIAKDGAYRLKSILPAPLRRFVN